jgi:hypothetical protein
VDGTGAATLLVAPRDPTLHRQVELERTRPVLVATVRAGHAAWQAVAEDPGRGGRCEVEHDDVRTAQLVVLVDGDAGRDGAAVPSQNGGQRVGDGPRPAFGDRPTVGVAGGGEGQPHRRRERAPQRVDLVRRDAAEQGPRLGVPEPAGQHRRRLDRGQPESGQANGVAWDAQNRSQDVDGQVGVHCGQRLEESAPRRSVGAQARGRVVHGAAQHARRPVVERVGQVQRRPSPGDVEIQGTQERRRQRRRVER